MGFLSLSPTERGPEISGPMPRQHPAVPWSSRLELHCPFAFRSRSQLQLWENYQVTRGSRVTSPGHHYPLQNSPGILGDSVLGLSFSHSDTRLVQDHFCFFTSPCNLHPGESIAGIGLEVFCTKTSRKNMKHVISFFVFVFCFPGCVPNKRNVNSPEPSRSPEPSMSGHLNGVICFLPFSLVLSTF